MRIAATATVDIIKVGAAQVTAARDELAIEEPLELQLGQEEDQASRRVLAVTMRTPGHDEELALGFLLTEGILQHPRQVASVALAGENKVVVQWQAGEKPRLQQAERNFYTTSSCGVCGKSSIDAIRTVSLYPPALDDICLAAPVFWGLEAALRQQQAIFASTGGLHASALFDLDGHFLRLREDVGRHNALDKLIGSAFQAGELPLDHHILLLSGRASFELVQKAAMAGIRVVAAVGAPSSLAVQLAAEAGITLIGFLRPGGFNIYSGAQRIAPGGSTGASGN